MTTRSGVGVAIVCATVVFAGAGCAPGGDAPDVGEAPASTAAATAAAAGVVDSVVPIEVALERFREGLERPAALRSGALTRDALVARIVDLLQRADTAGFEAVAVDRAEWAWFFYPASPIAHPPYELPPELAWFRLAEGNRMGVLRALREFGGRSLEYGGYRCPDEPTSFGEGRVWDGCVVTLGRDGEAPVPVQLFSGVLERDGRFAVLSFENDF